MTDKDRLDKAVWFYSMGMIDAQDFTLGKHGYQLLGSNTTTNQWLMRIKLHWRLMEI